MANQHSFKQQVLVMSIIALVATKIIQLIMFKDYFSGYFLVGLDYILVNVVVPLSFLIFILKRNRVGYIIISAWSARFLLESLIAVVNNLNVIRTDSAGFLIQAGIFVFSSASIIASVKMYRQKQ